MNFSPPKRESFLSIKQSGSCHLSSQWEFIPRAEEMDLPELFETEGSVLSNLGKEGHSESKVWH